MYKKTLYNGIRLKCPACGKGKLFASYLKLNENCSACYYNLTKLQADDAPAWATIFIVGHLVVPLMIISEKYHLLPFWYEMGLLIIISIIAVFVVLPFTKGVFVALIWFLQNKSKKKQS